jgi:hypothetical protein
MGLKRSSAILQPPEGETVIFTRPSDAAFLLGVTRQSLWDRINRGTVLAMPFNGGRWVCLEFVAGDWRVREPLTEEQMAALPPRSGPPHVVRLNLNVV